MKLAGILLVSSLLCPQIDAQRPQIDNAALAEHALAGSLAGQFSQFGAGPYWAGYTEPIIPGHRGDMCNDTHTVGSPLRLEGQIALVILIRMEAGKVTELRTTSPDCHLDGGGLPFHWINNVSAAQSIAWLKAQVPVSHTDTAIMAISLHPGNDATQALEDLTAVSQPEAIRKKAGFWLGSSRGAEGVASLKRMLANDPSQSVREQAIFALSQSKDPGGIPAVIDAARNDKDAHVRGQALFWLAQKAADLQTRNVINSAVSNDGDAAVRERAVFALSQIPNGEGVPPLIDAAKNNRYPEVRKKAIFWLGQSKDQRALDFLPRY